MRATLVNIFIVASTSAYVGAQCTGSYSYNSTSSIMSANVSCSVANTIIGVDGFTIDYKLTNGLTNEVSAVGTLTYERSGSFGLAYHLVSSTDQHPANASSICRSELFAPKDLNWAPYNSKPAGTFVSAAIDCAGEALVQPEHGVANSTNGKLLKRTSSLTQIPADTNVGCSATMYAYTLSAGYSVTFYQYVSGSYRESTLPLYSAGDYVKAVGSTVSTSNLYTGYLNEYGGTTCLSIQYSFYSTLSQVITCDNSIYSCNYQRGYYSHDYYTVSAMTSRGSVTSCVNGAAIPDSPSRICCSSATPYERAGMTGYYRCSDDSLPYLYNPPAPVSSPSASSAPPSSPSSPALIIYAPVGQATAWPSGTYTRTSAGCNFGGDQTCSDACSLRISVVLSGPMNTFTSLDVPTSSACNCGSPISISNGVLTQNGLSLYITVTGSVYTISLPLTSTDYCRVDYSLVAGTGPSPQPKPSSSNPTQPTTLLYALLTLTLALML